MGHVQYGIDAAKFQVAFQGLAVSVWNRYSRKGIFFQYGAEFRSGSNPVPFAAAPLMNRTLNVDSFSIFLDMVFFFWKQICGCRVPVVALHLGIRRSCVKGLHSNGGLQLLVCIEYPIRMA